MIYEALFSLFVVFDKDLMNQNIEFSEILPSEKLKISTDEVTHILCLSGGFSFNFDSIRWIVGKGDYVILPVGSVASSFVQNEECKILLLKLKESFVSGIPFNTDYGALGHLSLLTNPVIKLDDQEFENCRNDLLRLQARVKDTNHLFYDELIASLLKAHVLDLYDIHTRRSRSKNASSKPARILNNFIGLLIRGDYINDRSLSYYAAKLFISKHYLSEICWNLTGKSAKYWIDFFLISAIARKLAAKDRAIGQLASDFNFKNISYFSRFVKKQLGFSPSDFLKDRYR